MGPLSSIALHAEFRYPPASPEETAVEEQTPEEGSLKDDFEGGIRRGTGRIEPHEMHGI